MTTRNHIARSLRSPHLAPKRAAPRKGKGSFRRKAKHPRYRRGVNLNKRHPRR